MPALLKIAVVLLAVGFASTSFYAYTFYNSAALPQSSASTEVDNIKEVVRDEGSHMCNVAVGIFTQPAHATTRITDARKSWTRRICPYGAAQYLFVGLPEDLQVAKSVNVPCEHDYYSLCCKSANGFKLLFEKYPNADWYYKVDDDSLLIPANVDKMLAKWDPNDKLLLGWSIEAGIDPVTKEFHGQIFEPRVEHHNGEILNASIFYCSGSAYVMSGALMRGMMANITKYDEVWQPICDLYDPEDVAMGLLTAMFGARVAKIQGVYNKGWNWDENTGPVEEQFIDIVSVHLSRSTDKMILVDKLLSGKMPTPKPNT